MGFSVTDAISRKVIDDLLDRALAEDLGAEGDITSEAIFTPADTSRALIRCKASGILSGVSLLPPLFLKIDPSVILELLLDDGAVLSPGSDICRFSGPVRGILAGERVALNFLQRLSGIATLTSRYAAAIAHTPARLLDTRKTTPTLRSLEKAAVRHGGGFNHRFGLFDMMLIKDTHVKRAGSVDAAARKALNWRGQKAFPKIEVEVQTLDEFREALALHPNRIMLDNMSIDDLRHCVALRRSSSVTVELEASGSITLDTIAAVAETGVDFISCGSITHSAPALDLHLIIV